MLADGGAEGSLVLEDVRVADLKKTRHAVCLGTCEMKFETRSVAPSIVADPEHRSQ